VVVEGYEFRVHETRFGLKPQRMRVRKRIFWPVVALLLLAAVAGAWWWTGAHQAPPQIITLPNGERYQFVGATYGTRNVPPVLAAELVSWLPARLASLARRYIGGSAVQFRAGGKFGKPRLLVWFRALGTNAFVPSIVLDDRLADQAGNEAGVESVADFTRFFHLGDWTYADFSTFPRRSRVIQCNLYTSVAINSTNPPALVGSIHFPNPAYGRFPQWKPESLPTTKKAGDVEVRLDDLTTGHLISSGLGLRTAKGGETTMTKLHVSLISPAGSPESWVTQGEELSDATGNIISNVFYSSLLAGDGMPSGKSGFSGYLFRTLWPDEPAWRLKLEIKRAAGFTQEELVTFKNVPLPSLGTSNDIRRTNDISGVQLVLTSFTRSEAQTNSKGISSSATFYIALPRRATGVAVDVLKIFTDTGQLLSVSEPYGPHQTTPLISLPSIPTNAQTVDITMVVQKTRTVEFLVKPPKAE
jgi:hypothetical protein